MNKDVPRIKNIILLIVFLVCGNLSLAAERYEFYNGVRQLGMGGVAVATVNDETALMLNPAGLGKLRNSILTVLDPEIEGGGDYYGTLKSHEFNFFDLFSPQGLLDALNKNKDHHYHFKQQFFPSFVLPNFGLGVLANWNYDAEVVSEDDEFLFRYRNDFSAIMGFNMRLFEGRVKLGVTGRYIHRVEVDSEEDPESKDLKLSELADEGTGVAADVGLLLTGPWLYLPTIGAVLRDVGNTSYTLGGGMIYGGRPAPETTKQTVDVGFSITPILANHVRLQIAGEYRDVMDAYEEKNPIRRMHAGMELNFSDHIFFRGGYNQGYWTAGVEIAYLSTQLQLASYGEEIGDKDGPSREDRRYVFKFVFRF